MGTCTLLRNNRVKFCKCFWGRTQRAPTQVAHQWSSREVVDSHNPYAVTGRIYRCRPLHADAIGCTRPDAEKDRVATFSAPTRSSIGACITHQADTFYVRGRGIRISQNLYKRNKPGPCNRQTSTRWAAHPQRCKKLTSCCISLFIAAHS